jgi:hypothetical protein
MKKVDWTVNTITVMVFSLVVMALFVYCGKDSPTESSESLCKRLTIDSGFPAIKFKRACRSSSSTIENIQYNDFGQIISFDFDITCTSTSENYSGRVFNLQYQSGNVVAYDATINGQSCHYPN